MTAAGVMKKIIGMIDKTGAVHGLILTQSNRRNKGIDPANLYNKIADDLGFGYNEQAQ